MSELDLPVLVTSGRYDEMTATFVRPLVEGIRRAEWVVFENSAHIATLEERARYREVLESFLAQVDEGQK